MNEFVIFYDSLETISIIYVFLYLKTPLTDIFAKKNNDI